MQMPVQIHSLDLDALERASLPDIEFVRGQLGIKYADLCREAEIDVGSYRRWRLWMQGRAGGGEPSRSSMVAVRAGLRKLIEKRQRALAECQIAAE